MAELAGYCSDRLYVEYGGLTPCDLTEASFRGTRQKVMRFVQLSSKTDLSGGSAP